MKNNCKNCKYFSWMNEEIICRKFKKVMYSMNATCDKWDEETDVSREADFFDSIFGANKLNP